jgi:hypothetical protein
VRITWIGQLNDLLKRCDENQKLALLPSLALHRDLGFCSSPIERNAPLASYLFPSSKICHCCGVLLCRRYVEAQLN